MPHSSSTTLALRSICAQTRLLVGQPNRSPVGAFQHSTPHAVYHTRESPRPSLSPKEVCEYEKIDFFCEKSDDEFLIRLNRELYNEVLAFQHKSSGTETLPELMKMKSRWSLRGPNMPKITVILNHFKRKTLSLCSARCTPPCLFTMCGC